MVVYGIFRNELTSFFGTDTLLEGCLYSQEEYANEACKFLNARNENDLLHFFVKEINVK